MSSNLKYLIVKACAGVGNRLVTIFSAIKYCERNNRVLVIDWSDGQFDEKGVDAFGGCFELENIATEKFVNITSWDKLSHSSDLFKENKQASIYDLYKSYHSNFWHKFPSKLFFTSSLTQLRRKWVPINKSNSRSLNYGSDLSDGVKFDVLYYVDFLPYVDYSKLPNYIKLKEHVKFKIDTFVKANGVDELVGVHIRSTDKRPTKDVLKVIEEVKEKHNDRRVYLSTDSQEVEEVFSKYFPDLILYPKQKPKLKDEGLHQWALRNNEEKMKFILFEESVIEMFLLSKCKFLYYQGNSTFSNISRVYHLNKENCYDWLKL